MSKLLYDEAPLLVFPTLASIIGLNEAIILQQIHYWNEINKKSDNNFRDGYFWTYNTYEKWQEQFPFWHVNTIKKTIYRLESNNYIISGNYNKSKIDRTKWYRVNHEKLDSIEAELQESKQKSSPIVQILSNASNNIDTTQKTRNVRAIPETTSKTTSKTSEKYNAPFLDEMAVSPLFKNKEVVRAMRVYISDLYTRKTKKKHPILKAEQYRRVYEELCAMEAGSETLIDMMYDFLNSKSIKSDWNINHFATEGILTVRNFHCM